MKRLYVNLCTRYFGMSLSALAWRRAQHGMPWWRNRIDGAFLLFFGQHQHCQAQFQRERGERFLPADID